MSGLLILGAGGQGRVVAYTARVTGRWSEIAFLDDRFPNADSVDGVRVLGRFADAEPLWARFLDAVVALGDSHARLHLLADVRAKGFRFPIILHPSAAVSDVAVLGAGTVVFSQAAINPGAELGEACIINTSASVDHDCRIGAGVHLSPGVHVGGDVTIGERTWLGLGVNVKHGITIGKDVIVGVGAAVVSDLPDGVTAMGVPARVVKASVTL